MINKEREYQTRDGRSVEILYTDLGGHRPIGAMVSSGRFKWLKQYNTEGRLTLHSETDFDLIEIRSTPYERPNVDDRAPFKLCKVASGRVNRRFCNTFLQAMNTLGEKYYSKSYDAVIDKDGNIVFKLEDQAS
jgi:hypothetical protein